jgi:hypothetical protein
MSHLLLSMFHSMFSMCGLFISMSHLLFSMSPSMSSMSRLFLSMSHLLLSMFHSLFSMCGLLISMSHLPISMFHSAISIKYNKTANRHEPLAVPLFYLAGGTSSVVPVFPEVPEPVVPCALTRRLNTNRSFFSLSFLNSCCPMAQMSIARS